MNSLVLHIFPCDHLYTCRVWPRLHLSSLGHAWKWHQVLDLLTRWSPSSINCENNFDFNFIHYAQTRCKRLIICVNKIYYLQLYNWCLFGARISATIMMVGWSVHISLALTWLTGFRPEDSLVWQMQINKILTSNIHWIYGYLSCFMESEMVPKHCGHKYLLTHFTQQGISDNFTWIIHAGCLTNYLYNHLCGYMWNDPKWYQLQTFLSIYCEIVMPYVDINFYLYWLQWWFITW